MGEVFETYRMVEILQVPTKWQVMVPVNPTKEGMINLFKNNTAIKE